MLLVPTWSVIRSEDVDGNNVMVVWGMGQTMVAYGILICLFGPKVYIIMTGGAEDVTSSMPRSKSKGSSANGLSHSQSLHGEPFPLTLTIDRAKSVPKEDIKNMLNDLQLRKATMEKEILELTQQLEEA